MIKRILVMIVFMLTATFCYANTHLPGGLVIGTIADEATADVTPGTKDVFVDGTLEVDGATRLDGAVTLYGGLTSEGKVTGSMGSQTIGVGTAVVITDRYMVITSTGDLFTSTATPFISTATATNPDGTLVTVISATTSVITLQDADTLSDTCLELMDTTRALGLNDKLTLVMDGGKWWEVQFSDADMILPVSTITVTNAYGVKFLTDGDPTSTPTAVGILMIDTASNCELYISTGVTSNAWEKVGAQ